MDANLSPANVKGTIKRQWIEVVVTRADGTVEDYGIVADTRLSWRLAQVCKRATRALSQIFGKDR
jgi:hypothetical protein